VIKVSAREKFIALICVVLCLFFAARNFFADGLPGYGSATRDQIKAAAFRLREARAELAREQLYEKKLGVLAGVFGRSSGEGAEISSMSSRVHALARKSGVRILNIQPASVIGEEYYFIYPLEVSFEGGWKGVARFLFETGSASDRVEIRSLRLEKYSESFLELRGTMVISRTRLR
jgi:Tfp pilus assembly protein PilO